MKVHAVRYSAAAGWSADQQTSATWSMPSFCSPSRRSVFTHTLMNTHMHQHIMAGCAMRRTVLLVCNSVNTIRALQKTGPTCRIKDLCKSLPRVGHSGTTGHPFGNAPLVPVDRGRCAEINIHVKDNHMLLFAVPLHRNSEVVNNILRMSAGAIVVHINGLAVPLQIVNSSRVVINSERLKMRSPHIPSPNSLLEIFQSNLKAADHLPWTHAVHMTSNERIVRGGIDAYILGSSALGGFSSIPRYGCASTFVHGTCHPHGETVTQYKKLWPHISPFRYGQVDGAFFRRSVLVGLRHTHYSHKICCPQEKMLPSLFGNASVPPAITFMNWNEHLNILCDDVRRVRAGEYEGVFAVKRASNVLLMSCKNVLF